MAERIHPLQAQDKLAFLLSLVPYLMDRDHVSVVEAAEHFDVEADQIRSAVRLIAVSGIPGESGFYQHGDLFDIAWDDFENDDQIVLTHNVAIDYSPKFSSKEAAALIAGLQYLSALPEQSDRDVIGSLMTKLALGASAAPSEVAVAERQTDESLKAIRDAQDAGMQVEFDYLNARGEHERRRVDPLRIESTDQDWYLRGWCHLRQAMRTFRLDRMVDVQATTDAITQRAADVVLPETLFQGSDDDLSVIVELPTSALPLIADYAPEGRDLNDAAARATTDGRIRTTIRVAHYHGLKRLVAGLPGVVTVISPDHARQTVAQWAALGAARYEEK